MNIVETRNLTKCYKQNRVVDNLSIGVGQGEIYGFLGLNGAGKTTTIRMLLGMIRPDAGSVEIFGQAVQVSKGPWEKIGYMVETPGSYPNLTVRENLEVIYYLRKLRNKTSIDEVIEKLSIKKYEKVLAKNLSLGNAQRLGLAKALIHRPEILILDEPTNGLDPEGIVEIRELLKELSEQEKVTIIISSHLLNEISKIATRIGVIHEGKMVKQINTVELKNQLRKSLVLDFVNREEARNILISKGITCQSTRDGMIEILDENAIIKPEELAILLVSHRCPPKSMIPLTEDLENYFLRTINSTRKKSDG